MIEHTSDEVLLEVEAEIQAVETDGGVVLIEANESVQDIINSDADPVIIETEGRQGPPGRNGTDGTNGVDGASWSQLEW